MHPNISGVNSTQECSIINLLARKICNPNTLNAAINPSFDAGYNKKFSYINNKGQKKLVEVPVYHKQVAELCTYPSSNILFYINVCNNSWLQSGFVHQQNSNAFCIQLRLISADTQQNCHVLAALFKLNVAQTELKTWHNNDRSLTRQNYCTIAEISQVIANQ